MHMKFRQASKQVAPNDIATKVLQAIKRSAQLPGRWWHVYCQLAASLPIIQLANLTNTPVHTSAS